MILLSGSSNERMTAVEGVEVTGEWGSAASAVAT